MKVALELCPKDEHHRRLERDVAEMEAMVTELLELERLRQGKGMRLERADLVRLVREVVEACQEPLPGVVLGELPGQLELTVDPEKIRRVLSNLLENASKFSLPDSQPTRVSVLEQDGAVVVRVEDDGPGIPAELFASVFEPFFRADRSRSRKTGGYGLGLSLCRRIMEAHGGTIELANRAGRGAVFTLTLPRARSSRA
ncbi:MAG: ATP-binding protein [Myxococcales bacterium]